MKNAAAKLTFIIHCYTFIIYYTFNVTLLISRMVISKEDALFKTGPKPQSKCPVALD